MRRRGAPPVSYASDTVKVSGSTTGGKFTNPTNVGAGSYGYGSSKQATFSKNFGGSSAGVSETSYGYSGAAAYGPSSTSNSKNSMSFVAPALALGTGVALGAGGSYLYYQYTKHDEECNCNSLGPCYLDGQDAEYSTCAECERANSVAASDCGMRLGMDVSRDDVMTMAFVPADYSKVTLTISDISDVGSGTAYSKALVCPPDTETNHSTWNRNNAGSIPQLFVTLTRMDQLDSGRSASSARPPAVLDFSTTLLGLLALRAAFRR